MGSRRGRHCAWCKLIPALQHANSNTCVWGSILWASRHCNHCSIVHVAMQIRLLSARVIDVERMFDLEPTCNTATIVWDTAHQHQQRWQGQQGPCGWTPAPGGALARCTSPAGLAPGLLWPPCLARRTRTHRSTRQLQPEDSQTGVLRPDGGKGYRAMVDMAEDLILHLYCMMALTD